MSEPLGFYERAFELKTKFYDPEYEYGELEIEGATIGIASHRLGQFLTRDSYHMDASRNSLGGFVEIAFILENVETAFERAAAAAPKSLPRRKQCLGERPWRACKARKGALIGLSTPMPLNNQ